MLENGFYVVTWHDHDERERVKTPSDLRKVSKVDVQGLRGVGLPAGPGNLGQDSEQRARSSHGPASSCAVDKGGVSRCIRGFTHKHAHTHTRTQTTYFSLFPLNLYICIYVHG